MLGRKRNGPVGIWRRTTPIGGEPARGRGFQTHPSFSSASTSSSSSSFHCHMAQKRGGYFCSAPRLNGRLDLPIGPSTRLCAPSIPSSSIPKRASPSSVAWRQGRRSIRDIRAFFFSDSFQLKMQNARRRPVVAVTGFPFDRVRWSRRG